MRKTLAVAALAAALPLGAQAQSLQPGGFYIGAEGGLNWMFNNSFNTSFTALGVTLNGTTNATMNTGWAAGGVVGYDFIGPRVELEGVYRDNTGTGQFNIGGITSSTFGLDVNQVSVMANLYYDFFAGSVITPYIGAGAGVAFVNASALNASSNSTQFAYQGILGVGWNIDNNFRLNLDGRFYGTTNPTFNSTAVNGTFTNNNVTAMLSLQYKFGPPAPPPPVVEKPVQAPSFMVFFDWDRSNLSAQALATIKQAADTFKSTGKARITATGHTDRSGPEAYNMALSLRRASAVKDALVRNGVPATAIAVVGRGETQPLVPTADGVREPQNRRVEIVLQ
ncbi:MAG TPA: OmpA family protein [Reyranella sp.]|nr:OmpA family protein [Reyranella sp.]